MPRLDQIKIFLEENNLQFNDLKPIQNDASFRQYFRINDKILMDADPALGENIKLFININSLLKDFKLNAPTIFVKDSINGFILLEDLGEELFSKILDNKNEEELYLKAIKILSVIHQQDLNNFPQSNYIDNYSIDSLIKESLLFIDWYLKIHLKINLDSKKINEFKKILSAIFVQLDCKYDKLVLRDYHVDNLILQKSKDTLMQVGILDFQDAARGSSSYDLASIIEDVRRPISHELKNKLVASFIDQTNYNPELLAKEISFYSLQRNLKILGIFCRLNYRDNKTKYMSLNSNAWVYINFHLENLMMAELKDWMHSIIPNEK